MNPSFYLKTLTQIDSASGLLLTYPYYTVEFEMPSLKYHN